MAERVPEKNKKPGLCYAWTDETGDLPALELPVIDITHPSFAFEISEAQTSDLMDGLVSSTRRLAQTPPAALQSILQNSILMRGMLLDSSGTYTSGIMTYLNKLGPDNLGEGYASPLDRQWAASLTPVTFRWRMRDVARLLADGLASAMKARQEAVCPVHLINIGGGTAMDSLNALILLQKEHPGLLDGRQITVHVLDLDREGPRFGGRALAALLSPGGPLHGLQAEYNYTEYNWADTRLLRQLVSSITGENPVVAGSSEGGLFEFGSDQEILSNLETLCAGTPHDLMMAGPVVRDASTLDPRLKMTEHVPGRPAIRFLGLETFSKLAGSAGWRIDRHLDGPMHQVVVLKKVTRD